ncbi:MAG: DUF2849 domain-containing protein [Gammaproteobacteria bacterium]
MAQSIIANRLSDGRVVFFVEAGRWTERVDSAAVFETVDSAQRQLELARADEVACLVIDPNLIDVEVADSHIRPTAIREAIRAFGPTPEARTDAPRSAGA